MKISGRKPVSGTTPITGTTRVTRQDRADLAPSTTPAADVEISNTLREVDKARQSMAAMSDVRVERVEEIKPLVDDGSYKVESEVLAKKMVDTSLKESANISKGK
jgi:flagellar biosynthesis anti-sigma factor FlgM